MCPFGHSVQLYRDERFLIDTITSFIRVGLDLNETVLVIVTAQHRQELSKTLTGDELRNDKLRFFDTTDFLALFMVEDWPNESQFMQGIETILGRAGETGRFASLVKRWRCSARKGKPPPPCGSKSCGIS